MSQSVTSSFENAKCDIKDDHTWQAQTAQEDGAHHAGR